ncbi:MAG TPA: pentapeptide repeat-containing protein [Ignavibacteria bacterium]|nr:pentapeptide repeat-containing protein [Ignavibacteria bacterium]HMR41738.1 pentapeptide repeat-containing protein [Ignavibacteria bacterium]
MREIYILDKIFQEKDFTHANKPLAKGEYENCVFNNSNFSGNDLSEFKFIDCTFNGCNLSLVKLNNTVLRDVKFNKCKMAGIGFDVSSDFGLSFTFDGCILNNSSFYKTMIKKTDFQNSQLKEVDFTETDLTDSVFDKCDLAQAVFDHTILTGADFRTSYNYSIDPGNNKIKKAKFSIYGIQGLLGKYDIVIEK